MGKYPFPTEMLIDIPLSSVICEYCWRYVLDDYYHYFYSSYSCYILLSGFKMSASPTVGRSQCLVFRWTENNKRIQRASSLPLHHIPASSAITANSSFVKEKMGSHPPADSAPTIPPEEDYSHPPSVDISTSSSLAKETMQDPEKAVLAPPPPPALNGTNPASFAKETTQIPSPEELANPLPPPSPHPSSLYRFRCYLFAEVTTSHADILLLSCCLISGLVDSTIYNAYGTFVSMQTGNTIFLGLGGATPHSTSKPYGWAKSFCSIVCFCLGCFLFSHVTRFLGNLRRSTLVASFLMQTVFIFIAAAVVQGGSVDGALSTITDDINWWTMIPIALLSFQSAGQIVGSRALNLSEIPTVVLTSMLHDISTDRNLAAGLGENVKRNRRVCAYFGILIGAIAGGFIGEGTERMQVPLWIAGGIKLVITAAWVIWPEKRRLPV